MRILCICVSVLCLFAACDKEFNSNPNAFSYEFAPSSFDASGFEFTDISCPDSNTCFLGTSIGDVFKSSDEGATWQNIADFGGESIYRIAFANQLVGYALVGLPSQAKTLYKTVDGGITWTNLKDYSPAVQSIQLFDENTLVLFGWDSLPTINSDPGASIIDRTDDGGQTWINIGGAVSKKLISRMNSLRFLNKNVGLIGVNDLDDEFSSLLKTTDGGQTWTEVAIPYTMDIGPIRYVSADTVLMIARVDEYFRHSTLRSTDGGNTWTRLTKQREKGITTFEVWDNYNGLAIGHLNGTLFRLTRTGEVRELMQKFEQAEAVKVVYLNNSNGILLTRNALYVFRKDFPV